MDADESEEAKDHLAFAEAAVARCVREQTLKNGKRIDGRAFDELRSLESDIDITGVVHGSALFARGDTQTLSTVTLGPLSDRQIVDDITIQDFRSFFHHYKSLPFAYGGVGRIFGVSRREVGHGALVEKALSWLLPDNENFPYTIRIVSEVLSSDGSTSQAAICSASLSLMATGVPIREPIAGIAIGLIRDAAGNHNLLTDIQAWEDFYGDMDFKIAGGRNGIYAIQLDMKIDGLPLPVIREVLEQARVARMKLLDRMSETIDAPRKRLPKNVIKFQKIIVATDAIARVIGPGGKNIKRVAAECDNVEIDVKDNGTVYLYHNDAETLEKAKKMVLENAAAPAAGNGGSNGFRKKNEKPPVVGSEHDGEIIGIKEYGLFVSLKGYEASGLMHLSRMPRKYAKKLDKNFSLKQRLRVRVSGIDEKNRISIE
nr:polyribonucleotide nucleotidyltransferase-like [Lytechinus pictus]